MSMYDLAGMSASATDPQQMMARWLMARGQQHGSQSGWAGGLNSGLSSIMAMALMTPGGADGLKNLMDGSSLSALGQYINPYGATGGGKALPVGNSGIAGGGV